MPRSTFDGALVGDDSAAGPAALRGAHVLARLAAGVPVPPVVFESLPTPWAGWASRLAEVRGDRIAALDLLLDGRDDADDIRRTIFAQDPVAPLDDSADTRNTADGPAAAPDGDRPRPELDPAALYGLAGDVVRAIEPHTEADPAALLVDLLVYFGSIVGRTAHARVEADDHYLNEFAVIVGDTAKGRKDTARGRVAALFAALQPKWANNQQMSGLSSGEGLINAVRDPVQTWKEIRGPKGEPPRYEMVITDPGIEDKRLLVCESEFASTLKVTGREGNTLSALLRQAWDGKTLRTLTRNSPLQATGAHISVLGHITVEELKRYLNETESANGFGNRFLWVYARRSKLLPDGGGNPDVSGLLPFLQQAIDFASQSDVIGRDPAASRLWASVYGDLSAGEQGLVGALTSRAEAHVLRLSVMYALLDCSASVRPEHLRAALAFWNYCQATVHYVFGDAVGDPIADRIIQALWSAPAGLTRSELHHVFSKNLPVARLDAALGVLQSNGRAVRQVVPASSEDGLGRPAEIWRVRNGATKETN
jgi:hypothetical protein